MATRELTYDVLIRLEKGIEAIKSALEQANKEAENQGEKAGKSYSKKFKEEIAKLKIDVLQGVNIDQSKINNIKNQINQALTDGKITATQAHTMLSSLESVSKKVAKQTGEEIKDGIENGASKIKMDKIGKDSGDSFGKLFQSAVLTYISADLFNKIKSIGLESFQTFATLDDKLADVRKTVGLTKDEAESFKDEIFAIGRTTRTSIDELLDIAVIGGQFGRTKEEIVDFTKNLNILSVALGDEFPGGVKEAATQVSKIGTIFKEFKDESGRPTTDSILNIGNALNLLSADGAATSPIISEFATRIGSISDVVGLSASDVLGFSATLQELAVEPERGASAVTRVLQLIAKAPDKFAKVVGLSSKEFKNIVNTDINEAFTMVSKAVAGSDLSATDFAETLDDLGLKGVYNTEIISKLGGNTELLAKRQGQASEALKNTNSLMNEYGIKNNNTAGDMEKFKNMVTEVKSEIGEALAPALVEAGEALKPLISQFISFIRENPQLVTGILLAVTAFTGLLTAGLALAPVIGAISTAIGFLASPVGLAVLAVAGLLAILALLYNNSETFRATINQAFGAVQQKIEGVVKTFNEKVKPEIETIFKEIETIFKALEPVITPFINSFVTFITGSIDNVSRIFSGLVTTISGVFTLISGILTGDGDKIRKGFEKIFSGLGNMIAGFLNQAIDNLNQFLRSLNSIGDQIQKATGVNVSDIPEIPKIPTFAKGGLVTGQGTGTSDSIPAMLSNGEFVMNAESVRKFFPILQAMNSNRPASNQTDNRQINSGNNVTQYIFGNNSLQYDF